MFKVWLAGLLALQHLGLSVAEQRVFDAFYPDDANPSFEKLTVSPEFEKWVEDLVKASNIPGLTLGVMHGDYLEFGAWGVKNEDGDKMTPDTLFGIASCSKAFLATSVGILMDDFAHGRNITPLPPNLDTFNWLTPVQDVLPGDWKLMDEWASSKSKMRDILSHQSGVPRHEFSYKRNDKPLDVVRRMRHLRPAFELRQRYHYNNQMYMLGAHIVTTYSGIPYPQFVKERIWDRLGMLQSTFGAKEAAKNGKLTQAWHLGKRLIPFWNSDDLIDLNGGPGGIMSSATDLMKWVRTLLNKGVNPATNETVIPLVTFEEITTAHTVVDGRATEPYFSIKGYGMGWNRGSYQGYEVLEHGGAIPGFSAEIFFLPSENLGIVALANGDMKHAQENAIAYRVMEDFLGLPRKASEKFLTQTSVSSASDTPAPRQETPLASALSSYAGSYHDEGYGTLTLCAPSSSSPHCIRVLDAFASFENTTNPEMPTLYASINSLWIDHIRFRHLHDHTFSLIGSQLFPNGYGKNTTAFEMLEDSGQEVTVEFVVRGEDVEGFGVKGFVRETTELERKGGSVKDVAEVWFERIE